MDVEIEADIIGVESPAGRSGEKPSRTERITARAYERYLERGGVDGSDMDDWLQAEREIDDDALAGARRAD